MKPVVIIGSGLAGYGLAQEFRKHDQQTPLTIITKDSGEYYSKPMLSNALTRGQSADALATQTAEQMAEKLNATILTDTTVSSIDTEKQTLCYGSETLAYRDLILATGAKPLLLPSFGCTPDDILHINNLNDYRLFRQQLTDKKNITIIGSGLIGCEYANDLSAAGFNVRVISFEQYPLQRFVPKEIGQLLQQALTDKHNVAWSLQESVQEIEFGDNVFQITTNKETYNADLVISAIGIRPDLNLAKRSKIETDRGIVVDSHLKTSADHVFALGDCAQVHDQVLPFIMPIRHCSVALAKTLAGSATEVVYPVMPVVVKTPAYPTTFYVPEYQHQGQWQFDISETGAQALLHDEKQQLIGFVLTGDQIKHRMALVKEIT